MHGRRSAACRRRGGESSERSRHERENRADRLERGRQRGGPGQNGLRRLSQPMKCASAMVGMVEGDSSISGRMACRSSVAEITGNSKTSAQPRAQRKTSGRAAVLPAGLPKTVEEARRRHSRPAGSSRESQQRLRKSSIHNTKLSWRIFRIAQRRQVTCVPAAGERGLHRFSRGQPLKGAPDSEEFSASIKRRPDTKPELSAAGKAATGPGRPAKAEGFGVSGEGWLSARGFQQWRRRGSRRRHGAACCQWEFER